MDKPYFVALFIGLCLLLTGPPATRVQKVTTPQTSRPTALTAAAPLLPSSALVPIPDETPWSHLIDSLTANLNKGPITSGILYDRALPFAAPEGFGLLLGCT